MILSFYRQRLGMSLRTFQGLTGGGGGLSIWRLLSIQKNAPLHQIMQSRKKKKLTFYSSSFQKVPLRESTDQKKALGFVDPSLFHFICLSLRSHLSWIYSFPIQLHHRKIEKPQRRPPSPVVQRGGKRYLVGVFGGSLWLHISSS